MRIAGRLSMRGRRLVPERAPYPQDFELVGVPVSRLELPRLPARTNQFLRRYIQRSLMLVAILLFLNFVDILNLYI